jgi:hypothetical protein
MISKLCLLAVFQSLAVPNADALESLERSIECTRNTLENQKKMHALLCEYTRLKKRFIKETSTKAEARQMVNISLEMSNMIEEGHLESLFNVEFLEELKVFSSFARKTSIVLKDEKP